MASDLGLLRNSITKGSGNIAGFLGEIVVGDHIKAEQANTYDYDLILPPSVSVDVKTKRTGVCPKEYYDCSVAAYNTSQACDYYAFTRVLNDYSKLWFIGLIPKLKYYEMARHLRKGERDGDNGFIVKADCYNLTIKEIWEYYKITVDSLG
jgi:hypothetical protein